MDEQQPADNREADDLRERLDALQLRVLDVVTTSLRARAWRRAAVVVSVVAIAATAVGLYFNASTHVENNRLAHVSRLDAQVDLDFDNVVSCFATGAPVPQQQACEAKRGKTLDADEATLEAALDS